MAAITIITRKRLNATSRRPSDGRRSAIPPPGSPPPEAIATTVTSDEDRAADHDGTPTPARLAAAR